MSASICFILDDKMTTNTILITNSFKFLTTSYGYLNNDTDHFVQQSIGVRSCEVQMEEVRLVLAPEGASQSEVCILPEPDQNVVGVSVLQDALERLVLFTESDRSAEGKRQRSYNTVCLCLFTLWSKAQRPLHNAS